MCRQSSTIAAGAAVFLMAASAEAQQPVPLKDAKLNIEHNATAEDTGFQGFIDSEGWQSLTVTGPDGPVLKFEGLGKLGSHGLTELFFETVEPANTDMSIEEVLSILPEGSYMIEGKAMEAGEDMGTTQGIARFTHDIPEGPSLIAPAEGAVVPAGAMEMSWATVSRTITGKPVDIIAYQLIVERDEEPHPNMIGKIGVSMYLPPSVTKIALPEGFLEPGTAYLWEVLAIEQSGNQTLSSSAFKTE